MPFESRDVAEELATPIALVEARVAAQSPQDGEAYVVWIIERLAERGDAGRAQSTRKLTHGGVRIGNFAEHRDQECAIERTRSNRQAASFPDDQVDPRA